jgi:hypothetical protein
MLSSSHVRLPLTFAAVAVLLAIMGLASGAVASDTASWLNVREMGASGSPFETTAVATEGSEQITVADPGDFKVGQSVTVSKCNVQYTSRLLWGPKTVYGSTRALGDAVEIRGYDGSAGSWIYYVLDLDGADPLTFRWSDDLARTWKASKVPITFDWQKLSGGTEVRFKHQEWQPGHIITFCARDQLVSVIEKIEGKVLTLRHTPNRTVTDCVVRHKDTEALQLAINRAIREHRNLYFPAGHYRIPGGLSVTKANLTLEGESGVDTVLDISDGNGSCFGLNGGAEVTIRNFRLIGHTGQIEAPGAFRSASGTLWCAALKGCNAMSVVGTERVLVENVHASRMSAECFYCQGPFRNGPAEIEQHTKSLTFLRCSVTDCAANAFNNNDASENTSILYCRVDGAGWQAYEGPGRFIKIIGNYVRNGGNGFWVGSMTHRYEHLHDLGVGQAIIADNVFEGIGRNWRGIFVAHGATQVVITNNLFINYNATAIEVSGDTARGVAYPSQNITISGNIIDMTDVGDKPVARVGIRASTSDTIISDNQIYVRGEPDPRVTGISLSEPALNVSVHDNLIRNCGFGLRTNRITSSITEVFDSLTFLENALPLTWRYSHCYRNWNLLWLNGSRANSLAVIDSYDPTTLRFKLTAPADMKVGDRFMVYAPGGANWAIRNNTITSCTNPLVLDSFGGPTSIVSDNILSRGGATGIKQAVEVRGRFNFEGNNFSGFDETGCVTLALFPDRLGQVIPNLYRNNIFENCANAVSESQKGLWDPARAIGNVFGGGSGPGQTESPQIRGGQAVPLLIAAPQQQVLRAVRLSKPITLDGAVDEWPWRDATRVISLAKTPEGNPIGGSTGTAMAARDDRNLYLAVRLPIAKGARVILGGPYQGDGLEVAFQNPEAKGRAPIYVLWGGADGKFDTVTAGGTSSAQLAKARQAITYAARVTEGQWTCEWRIPLDAVEVDAATAKRLMLNIGWLEKGSGTWTAWYATGGALYEVGGAGDVVLQGK